MRKNSRRHAEGIGVAQASVRRHWRQTGKRFGFLGGHGQLQCRLQHGKKIWEKGHRRIAFLSLEKQIYNANVSDRERGFVQASKDLGAECDPEKYIIRAKFDGDTVTENVKKFFAAQERRPSAIFCCVDTAVPFAVRALEEIGLSVPKDISVVGFDGFINYTYFKMKVATSPQPSGFDGRKSRRNFVEPHK